MNNTQELIDLLKEINAALRERNEQLAVDNHVLRNQVQNLKIKRDYEEKVGEVVK
jgi:uncharacterized protein YdbL (DUF1318 family)